MSTGLRAKIGGIEEAKNELKGLPPKLARRVVRPALTKATKPALMMAKRTAPSETKALGKSIARKIVTYTKTGNIVAVIGPKRGPTQMLIRPSSFSKKPQKVNPAHYGHLVHDPVRPHSLKKDDKLARSGAMADAQEARSIANIGRWTRELAEIGVLPSNASKQKRRTALLDRIFRHRERARIRRTEKQTAGGARHPGTKGDPWIARTFDTTKGQTQNIFVTEVRAGVAQLRVKGKL